MNKIKNYIKDKLTEPASKKHFDSFEPRTGKTYEVPDSKNEDLEAAIKAALEWLGMIETPFLFLIAINKND